MFPTISLGPLTLQAPGLILLISLYTGLWLAEKTAHRFGLSPDTPYNLAGSMLIGGLLGGRLVYALEYLDIFLRTPTNLFSLNLSLMSWPGALLTAIAIFFIYTKKKALDPWLVLDNLTPALAFTAVGAALAALAAGSFFGAPTDLPWGMPLWGKTRHPTQIYALLAALGVLWKIWRQLNVERPSGFLFLQFAVLTSSWFVLVSGLRGDSLLLPGGFRQDQVLAWITLVCCLYLLDRRLTANHG